MNRHTTYIDALLDWQADQAAKMSGAGNFISNPVGWDWCDRHEAAFPMADKCPKCAPEPQSGEQK